MRGKKRRHEVGEASHTRAAPFRHQLVIMAKLPVMGRVKSRLAGAIGAVEATRFYRHTLAAVVGRLATDGRWKTRLAVAPDGACGAPIWPRSVGCARQGPGDLGRRMQRIMDRSSPGPVIIVGTDIPGIVPRHIGEAFKRLQSVDGVIGAAPDGGYWLVGLRRSPRVLRPFHGVRWSSEYARADTAANLAGCDVAEVANLGDVDDAPSFYACRSWFGRRILPCHLK